MREVQATQLVVMAGGEGKRLGFDYPKPLVAVNGRSLIDWCLAYYGRCGFSLRALKP